MAVKPDDITQEDWDLLTEEERESFEEEEEEAGEEEETGEEENEDDPDAEEEEGDDDGEEEEASDDDAGEETGEEETAGEEEEEKAAADDDYQPLLRADLDPEAETKLQEIATKREELDTQFDDGELTTKEFRQALADLDKQERSIEQQQFKAQIAQEMKEEADRAAWMKEVRTFLDDHPEYEERPRLYDNLDAVVKELAADDKNAGLTGDEILVKAHEKVYTDLGLPVPDAKKKEENNGDKKPAGKKRTKKPAPPNLGSVPSSDTSDPTKSGQFTQLDKLADTNPQKFEEAFAKLSEAEQERYLAAQ